MSKLKTNAVTARLMMANSEVIKEFLVGIGFDVKDDGLQKIKKFSLGLAAAATAATAAFYGVGKAINSTAEKFDTLGSRADRLGATATELEKISYAAKLSGSSARDAERSLELFSRRIGETAMGIGEGRIVFEKLGISVRDANGLVKNTAAIMSEVGAKIKDMKRTEQLSVLDKLGFKHSMVNVVLGDMTALGAEFDELQKAANLNIDATAQNATTFKNAMFRLKYGFETFKDSLASAVLLPMADTANSMTKRFIEFMATSVRFLQPFVKRAAQILGGLIKVFARISTGVSNLIAATARPFLWFFSQMPTWAKWIAGLTLAFKGLTLAFAASPVGAVVALAIAIAALVDDFLVWKNGGQSFLDWSAWEPAINSATAAVQNFVQIFRDLFSAVFAVIGMIKDLFTLNFEGFLNKWKVAVDSVCNAFKSLWETFKSIGEFFGNLGGAAMGFFNMVANKMGFDGFNGIAPAQPKVLADVKSAGANNNIQVKTDIVVQGATDPATTANIVLDKQARTVGGAVRDNTAVIQ